MGTVYRKHNTDLTSDSVDERRNIYKASGAVAS